jgi:hypothetical protein
MKIFKIANSKVLEAENLIKQMQQNDMVVLFHSSTKDQDQSIIENGLEAQIGEWVKECLYGATDSEECINEIIEKTAAVYFSKLPNWVVAKISKYKQGKGDYSRVTTEDIENYGQLSIVGVPVDSDYIYEAKEYGEEAVALDGESTLYSDEIPFGVETGDLFAIEDMAVDITLTGKDLVNFLLRNYPEEI